MCGAGSRSKHSNLFVRIFFFFYMTTGLSLSLRFLSACIQHSPNTTFCFKIFFGENRAGPNGHIDMINEL